MKRKGFAILLSLSLAVTSLAGSAFASEEPEPVTVEGGMLTGVAADVDRKSVV